MIGLPYPPSTTRMKAFWLSMSILGSAFIAYFLNGIFSIPGLLWGGGFIVILTVVGWRSEKLMNYSYTKWNRVVGAVARFGRAWIVFIVLVILTVVGRLGSRVTTSSPDKLTSIWNDRHDIHSMDGGRISEYASERGWVQNYFRWCIESNNSWAAFLFPYLLLLSALELDRYKSKIPKDTYTLY